MGDPVYVYLQEDDGRWSARSRQPSRRSDEGWDQLREGPYGRGQQVLDGNRANNHCCPRPRPVHLNSTHPVLGLHLGRVLDVWQYLDDTGIVGRRRRSGQGGRSETTGFIHPDGTTASAYTSTGSSAQIKVEGTPNPEVLISISDATATEGPGVTMDFVVTLNRSWSRTITVEYITLFTVSATPGVDYQNRTGTLTFRPGETSKIISVPIIDDNVPDSGETFELLLYDAKGADLDDDVGIGTILNTEILTGGRTGTGTILNTEVLTGSFENVPAEHDGSTPFTFDAVFNSDIGISYATLRDHSFTVTNGKVTGARRNNGRNDSWEITVTPWGNDAVTVTLPGNRDCGTTEAICTKEDHPVQLSNSPSATVAGPPGVSTVPLTASFSGVPVSHDGQHAFTFGSDVQRGRGGAELPDVARLGVLGDERARVSAGAPQRQQGSNQGWTVTVDPTGNGGVSITLPETTNCSNAGAICTDDGRKLNHSTSATIPGPAAALDFAHFAKGATITSEMVLVNAAPHPSRPAIYFYDTKGDPIPAESVVDLTGDLEVTEDGGSDGLDGDGAAGSAHDFDPWAGGAGDGIGDGAL